MKRVLAIVLGLCLLSGLSVNADIDTIEGSTIAGGGEGGCSESPTINVDCSTGLEWLADYYYVGVKYTPTSNINICKVSVELGEVTGDISGLTYTVRIWSVDGGDDLDTELGTSSGVTGSNAWGGFVEFEFPSSCSLTASTTYAVTVDQGGAGAAYPRVYYTNPGSSAETALMRAESNLEVTDYTYDFSIQIYGE
jgi:hypothetical protein